jgi:hypothetical protein
MTTRFAGLQKHPIDLRVSIIPGQWSLARLYLSSRASSTYRSFQHPCYTTNSHIPSPHPIPAASLPINLLVSNLKTRRKPKQKSCERTSLPNKVICTTHLLSQLYNGIYMIVLYLANNIRSKLPPMMKSTRMAPEPHTRCVDPPYVRISAHVKRTLEYSLKVYVSRDRRSTWSRAVKRSSLRRIQFYYNEYTMHGLAESLQSDDRVHLPPTNSQNKLHRTPFKLGSLFGSKTSSTYHPTRLTYSPPTR